jgi:hypothetical protein
VGQVFPAVEDLVRFQAADLPVVEVDHQAAEVDHLAVVVVAHQVVVVDANIKVLKSIF